jgi:arabinan endo-1,5-alpha-L-arabinosidase
MIRFRPGISILGAFLVAVLLFPFRPSWRAGTRAAEDPHAVHVEGNVLGARDPSIIKEGDTWYLFTSTPPDSKRPDQFPIRSSKNLTHWKACGYVFSEIPTWIKQRSPKTKELWAPDISFFDGKFHLNYAYSPFGVNTPGIALLTNRTLKPRSPDCPWADEGLPASESRAEDHCTAIDANLILDEKGQAWLDGRLTTCCVGWQYLERATGVGTFSCCMPLTA